MPHTPATCPGSSILAPTVLSSSLPCPLLCRLVLLQVRHSGSTLPAFQTMKAVLALLLLAAAAAGASTLSGPVVASLASTGFPTWDDLKQLYNSDPEGVKAAWTTCEQQGPCQAPCRDIRNCAGCHPSGGASVCAYCMPGSVLSADQRSCEACPAGTTSKGGTTTSCTKCPGGQTTATVGATSCVPDRKPETVTGASVGMCVCECVGAHGSGG
jgi:hypothetical protein